MGVGTVVISGSDDLDVGFRDGGFLGELLPEELCHEVEVAVEEPAHESHSKHVAAFEHALVVHALVGETLLDHGGERAGHDAVGVDTHLAEVVVGGEFRFLQVVGPEGVGVDDDGGRRFGVAVLCFQGGSVHGHEHVALVTGRVHLAFAHVDLEAGHTGE